MARMGLPESYAVWGSEGAYGGTRVWRSSTRAWPAGSLLPGLAGSPAALALFRSFTLSVRGLVCGERQCG
eukprot:3546652-Rhodomonas_salina.1